MLNSAQIVALHQNEEYKRIVKLRSNHIDKDLINSVEPEWIPDWSMGINSIIRFYWARKAREELYICSQRLIEKLLNSDIDWEGYPDQIQELCTGQTDNFKWLQYKKEQMYILFTFCIEFSQNPEFIAIIKDNFPSPQINEELKILPINLRQIREDVLTNIEENAIMDIQYFHRKRIFNNHSQIRERFINDQDHGNLGNLPKVELISDNKPEENAIKFKGRSG